MNSEPRFYRSSFWRITCGLARSTSRFSVSNTSSLVGAGGTSGDAALARISRFMARTNTVLELIRTLYAGALPLLTVRLAVAVRILSRRQAGVFLECPVEGRLRRETGLYTNAFQRQVIVLAAV